MFQRGHRQKPIPTSSGRRLSSRLDATLRQVPVAPSLQENGTRMNSRLDLTGSRGPETPAPQNSGTRMNSRLDTSLRQAPTAIPPQENGTRLNPRLDLTLRQPPQATPQPIAEIRIEAMRSERARREEAMGGVGFNTTFRTQHDVQMAARQVRYDELSVQDRSEQEVWAQSQLKQIVGRCPQSFGWIRETGGYRCGGGDHLVTDELLAEGKGRYYESGRRDMVSGLKPDLRLLDGSTWLGPYLRERGGDRGPNRLDQRYDQGHGRGWDRPLLRGRRSGR